MAFASPIWCATNGAIYARQAQSTLGSSTQSLKHFLGQLCPNSQDSFVHSESQNSLALSIYGKKDRLNVSTAWIILPRSGGEHSNKYNQLMVSWSQPYISEGWYRSPFRTWTKDLRNTPNQPVHVVLLRVHILFGTCCQYWITFCRSFATNLTLRTNMDNTCKI